MVELPECSYRREKNGEVKYCVNPRFTDGVVRELGVPQTPEGQFIVEDDGQEFFIDNSGGTFPVINVLSIDRSDCEDCVLARDKIEKIVHEKAAVRILDINMKFMLVIAEAKSPINE